MKDHTGCDKQFIILSEAWYSNASLNDDERARGVDEITFGYYAQGCGGTSGEMLIRWHALEAGKPPSARLEAFHDGWHALATFKDVLDALGELDDTYPTGAQVADTLRACGFKDATPRASPNPKQANKPKGASCGM